MSKLFSAGAGQVVSPDDLSLQNMLLTAAAGAATATVKDKAGVAQVVIAAQAGTSFEYTASNGGNLTSLTRIVGPVTIDVVGAGAFVRLSY